MDLDGVKIIVKSLSPFSIHILSQIAFYLLLYLPVVAKKKILISGRG
jgi:hypothetical protein